MLRYYLSMQVASSLQRCRKVRVRHLRRSPKECSQGDPARTRTANVRNGLTDRHTLIISFPRAHFPIQARYAFADLTNTPKILLEEIKSRTSRLQSTAVPQPYFAAQRNHSVSSSTLALRYYLSMQICILAAAFFRVEIRGSDI